VRESESAWTKASVSVGTGSCLEARIVGNGAVALRDSKNRSGPVLLIPGPDWTAFLESVKAGDLELDTLHAAYQPGYVVQEQLD
jgi:Domain of unknown function (DUF397)